MYCQLVYDASLFNISLIQEILQFGQNVIRLHPCKKKMKQCEITKMARNYKAAAWPCQNKPSLLFSHEGVDSVF